MKKITDKFLSVVAMALYCFIYLSPAILFFWKKDKMLTPRDEKFLIWFTKPIFNIIARISDRNYREDEETPKL